jgi:hypothetical protein
MSPLESPSSSDAQASMGATEDEVVRDKRLVAPEVTGMGIDELGRDHPDEAEFGRGEMPKQQPAPHATASRTIDSAGVEGKSGRPDVGDVTPGAHSQVTAPRAEAADGPPLQDDPPTTTPPAERSAQADTRQTGAHGGDTTGAVQPGQSAARSEPDMALPYPRRPTMTDLPTGGGAGGPRPHLNPQLDRLPGEAGKDGSP